AFIQTEQGVLVSDAQTFLQLLGWIVLYDNHDVFKPVAKLQGQFANHLVDQTFKRNLIHKAWYRVRKVWESIIGRAGLRASKHTRAAIFLSRGVEEAIYVATGALQLETELIFASASVLSASRSIVRDRSCHWQANGDHQVQRECSRQHTRRRPP